MLLLPKSLYISPAVSYFYGTEFGNLGWFMNVELFWVEFLKLQLCAGPNVNIVCCTNRDSSPRDLYIMTLFATVPSNRLLGNLGSIQRNFPYGTQLIYYVLYVCDSYVPNRIAIMSRSKLCSTATFLLFDERIPHLDRQLS